MGDYLLRVAGKPSDKSGRNNGSFATIKEVEFDLRENGYPQYSVPYLSQIRTVAHDFPASNRVRGVSWTTHHVAATPDVLIAVMDAAKSKGRKGVSKRFVQQIIDGMGADDRARRKGVEIRARKAADRAEEERAKHFAEKKRAERMQDKEAAKAAAKREEEATSRAERMRGRARKLRGAPKRVKGVSVPKPQDVPLLVAKTKFSADSSEAKALVKRMAREIEPHIDELSKAFVIGSVEELLEIADLFRKLATKLNCNQTEKRAHLHAVA